MKKKSEAEKMVALTVTIEPNQMASLKGLSTATGQTTSELVREMIRANAAKIAKATTTAKRRKGTFE